VFAAVAKKAALKKKISRVLAAAKDPLKSEKSQMSYKNH